MAGEDDIPRDVPACRTLGKGIADLKQSHEGNALIDAWLEGLSGRRVPLAERCRKEGCGADADGKPVVVWENNERRLLPGGVADAQAQACLRVTQNEVMGIESLVLG